MTQTSGDPGKSADEPAERPWWDDPSLPWSHKPTRSDLWCWGWIAVVGVYGLVMLPLRPLLLGLNPQLAAMITGGRASVVAAGAFTHVNGGPIVLYWVVVTLSIIKFDWIYWWAGRLWGPAVIEMFAGKSDRARKRAARAVRLTERYAVLAIVLTFLPVPLPMAVVYAALGAAGMRLRTFLTVLTVTAAVVQALYLGLGWWLGEPAVRLVTLYATYMWYVTIAILVGMLVTWAWRQRRRRSAA